MWPVICSDLGKVTPLEDQLLLFYCLVSGLVDLEYCVDVVYLDFLKAFDLVSHDVLVGNLR